MARPGWNAKGLLQPLWKSYPGGRDALASKIGTTGASLSSRNSGRLTLGHDLADRLATELSRGLGREVSVLELGAPEEEADQRGQTLVDRLEELAVKLADSISRQVKTDRELRSIRRRLAVLEAGNEPDAGDPRGSP